MTYGEHMTYRLAWGLATDMGHKTPLELSANVAIIQQRLHAAGLPELFDKIEEVLKPTSGPQESPRFLVQTLTQTGVNINRLLESFDAVKDALDVARTAEQYSTLFQD